MKIKDIVKDIEPIWLKVYTAHRIYRSEPRIKEAIAEWHEDRSLPDITLGMMSPQEEGYASISVQELVGIYGMKELDALLFLDSLAKATKKDNKTELDRLLGTLSTGKHKTNFVITEAMLEQVRKDSPEVWAEYQKLCNEAAQKKKVMISDYEQIAETEL